MSEPSLNIAVSLAHLVAAGARRAIFWLLQAAGHVAGGVHGFRRPVRCAQATYPSVLGAVAVLCIAVGAGASGAINMWFDRDIDAMMSTPTATADPAGTDAGTGAGFGVVLAIISVMLMGLALNWTAAGAARLHHLLLCRRLHDLAEAPDAAEHRDRRRAGAFRR